MITPKTLKAVLKKWNASLLQSAQEKLAPSNMWYFPILEKLAASENAAAIGGKEEDNNEDRIRTLVMAVESLADLLGPIETRKALVSVREGENNSNNNWVFKMYYISIVSKRERKGMNCCSTSSTEFDIHTCCGFFALRTEGQQPLPQFMFSWLGYNACT